MDGGAASIFEGRLHTAHEEELEFSERKWPCRGAGDERWAVGDGGRLMPHWPSARNSSTTGGVVRRGSQEEGIDVRRVLKRAAAWEAPPLFNGRRTNDDATTRASGNRTGRAVERKLADAAAVLSAYAAAEAEGASLLPIRTKSLWGQQDAPAPPSRPFASPPQPTLTLQQTRPPPSAADAATAQHSEPQAISGHSVPRSSPPPPNALTAVHVAEGDVGTVAPAHASAVSTVAPLSRTAAKACEEAAGEVAGEAGVAAAGNEEAGESGRQESVTIETDDLAARRAARQRAIAQGCVMAEGGVSQGGVVDRAAAAIETQREARHDLASIVSASAGQRSARREILEAAVPLNSSSR